MNFFDEVVDKIKKLICPVIDLCLASTRKNISWRIRFLLGVRKYVSTETGFWYNKDQHDCQIKKRVRWFSTDILQDYPLFIFVNTMYRLTENLWNTEMLYYFFVFKSLKTIIQEGQRD